MYQIYHKSSDKSSFKKDVKQNSVLSNSGFLSYEFKSNSGEIQENQGSFLCQRDFGIDTVRLKFYLVNKDELENYRACFYKECVTFNIVNQQYTRVYIYYNMFGQKFLYCDDGSCYLEFSLPKFLKYQNTAYCDELDLFYYCNKYLAPFCHNQYILLNRIDFAKQFSFNTSQELQGFDSFLKSVNIRHKSSSQDYCFWKFEERVIRFYEKFKDVQRLKSHPSQGEIYNQWLNTLRWTEEKNIGRLEYQLKLGYISKYFKGEERQILKINYDILRQVCRDMQSKDFPFSQFSYSNSLEFNSCLKKIENSFQRPDSYLKFLCLAQKYGISEARKYIDRRLYSNMKLKLKERCELTFEQILSAGDTLSNFPSSFLWEEKPYSTEQERDFTSLLAKNILQNNGDLVEDFNFDLEGEND